MSLFSCLVFFLSFFFWPKVLSHRGPTVARGLFMRPGDSEGKHKELSTQATGPWAQRWPLKDVCGLHPRHSGPAASDGGSSPHRCSSASSGLDLFAELKCSYPSSFSNMTWNCRWQRSPKRLESFLCVKCCSGKTMSRRVADAQWGSSGSQTSWWVWCWKMSAGSWNSSSRP